MPRPSRDASLKMTYIATNAYKFKRDVEPRKKAVEQLTEDGEQIAVYESTAEAARKTGFKSKQIQNCAREERKTYHGYVWRYVDGRKTKI